ncbi:MAG: hypothetical protein V1743_01235 [Nanoarchaeota archaeon]
MPIPPFFRKEKKDKDKHPAPPGQHLDSGKCGAIITGIRGMEEEERYS